MVVLRCLVLSLVAVCAMGEAVETLSRANFDARVKSDIILVKFYAPWCGHCKAMAPAYEEAAQKLSQRSPPIPLAKVDATVEPDITQAQGVRGYPTLKIFRKGIASDYAGPRDAEGIVKHMTEQAGTTKAQIATGDLSVDTKEAPSLMAVLCRDQTCSDANFPMIDYDENDNKCLCAAHPCWDDDGKHHSCNSEEAPHLKFSYTQEGQLECGCSKDPHYSSKYIAKVKCPGEHCEDSDLFVDYDPEHKKCVCKTHPCHSLDGTKHSCNDPKFPILAYREENKEGTVKRICECKAGIGNKKVEEL